MLQGSRRCVKIQKHLHPGGEILRLSDISAVLLRLPPSLISHRSRPWLPVPQLQLDGRARQTQAEEVLAGLGLVQLEFAKTVASLRYV